MAYSMHIFYMMYLYQCSKRMQETVPYTQKANMVPNSTLQCKQKKNEKKRENIDFIYTLK